jgi:hypothetical protein
MAKAPTTETIAAELTVPERVLLFCLASDTNLVKAEVSHSTAQHLLVRNPVERNHATDFTPTDQGRSVLDALIRKGPSRDDSRDGKADIALCVNSDQRGRARPHRDDL